MDTSWKEAVRQAYDDVRDDNTETQWAVFSFEGGAIVVNSSGSDHEEFISKFSDDDRAFGFVRVKTGDEMSVRTKFTLVTWIGENVSPMKRAKMSTEKSLIRTVIQNVAVDYMTSEKNELQLDHITEMCIKAGGANYGTGSR